MKVKILILLFLGIIVSCSNTQINYNDIYKFKYSNCTGLTVKGKKILLIGSWKLKYYDIIPSNKESIDLGSNDTLFLHIQPHVEIKNTYYYPSKDKLFINGNNIKSHTDISLSELSSKSTSAKRLYYCSILINNPTDSIINGFFRVSNINKYFLQLSQERTIKSNGYSSTLKLVFYNDTL